MHPFKALPLLLVLAAAAPTPSPDAETALEMRDEGNNKAAVQPLYNRVDAAIYKFRNHHKRGEDSTGDVLEERAQPAQGPELENALDTRGESDSRAAVQPLYSKVSAGINNVYRVKYHHKRDEDSAEDVLEEYAQPAPLYSAAKFKPIVYGKFGHKNAEGSEDPAEDSAGEPVEKRAIDKPAPLYPSYKFLPIIYQRLGHKNAEGSIEETVEKSEEQGAA